MTDNVAVMAGYTSEVVLEHHTVTLFLLVKPDQDLGERFRAWDTDNQEWIVVNGWSFSVLEE